MSEQSSPSSRTDRLSQERLEQLRARVRQDYYDCPQVLASVADRLLLSGDLGRLTD